MPSTAARGAGSPGLVSDEPVLDEPVLHEPVFHARGAMPGTPVSGAPADGFLSGGGALGRLIAATDWAATPLGPIEGWDQVMRTTVALILRSPVPIVTLWGGAGIMIYNDPYAVFAGHRHPRLLGSAVREGWDEVADFNDHVMRHCLAGGTLSYEDQALTLHRSGQPEPVWMNLDYSPVIGAAGRPVGVVAIVRETTGKVAAERALTVAAAALGTLNAELEQRVAERTRDRDRIWRLSTDVMLVGDLDGRIEAVNPAWTALLGWREDELLGRGVLDFIHADDLAPTRTELSALRRGLTTRRFENRYRARDGSYRWLSWTAVSDERFVHAVGRDIQREREAAEALRAAEEALRHAQKMEAVGQLTGGIAHEFNNLLTAIGGSLELITTRVRQGRSADLSRYTDAAEAALRRAASLTHRLLAFSRRQTLDPRPVDVNRLVERIEALVRRTVLGAITVETRLAPDLWSTRVDPGQLESGLLNLCINAHEAMPDGGRLVIETENRVLDAQAAQARDMQAGEYVTLSVRDDGTGMDGETARRAFDPFFTTKPIGQGTGLGLSMVYGFARQSGGQARIHSAPGRGTLVRLHLPRHRGATASASASASAGMPGSEPLPRAAGHETVLIVDDEATLRMLVVEVLDDLGYRAIEAADGVSALGIVDGGAPIDLLVTDIGLPGGMNGRQLADAARQIRPALPVLFITGYAEATVLGDRDLAPGMHVLTKPFSTEGLAGRIRDLLAAAPAGPAGGRPS